MADHSQAPITPPIQSAQEPDSHGQAVINISQGLPPDAVRPVIGNYLPPADASIDASDPIQFDVTDNLGLFVRVIVTVTLAGVTEVVHDGSQFRGLYAGLSARALIANGFRFTVARQGGWTASPTFETFAIDTAGNEAV